MMLLPRSRASFEAATASTSANGAPAAAFDDDADYAEFYRGKHAFECVEWAHDGKIMFMGSSAAGYEEISHSPGPVPAGILDDRAFARGFFMAPFQQVVDCSGAIRARGLPPNITLRELSLRLSAAVAERMVSDGYWKADGALDVDDEGAVDFAEDWVEEMGWRAPARELNFGDVYWRERYYIEGHTIVRGTAAGGGLVYVDSWGS